jgi:hypothetical protein
MINAIVREFGDLLGMGGLELQSDGALVLEIEPADTLCLVAGQDCLHVSLSRSHQYPHTPSAARLLSLCTLKKTTAIGPVADARISAGPMCLWRHFPPRVCGVRTFWMSSTDSQNFTTLRNHSNLAYSWPLSPIPLEHSISARELKKSPMPPVARVRPRSR